MRGEATNPQRPCTAQTFLNKQKQPKNKIFRAKKIVGSRASFGTRAYTHIREGFDKKAPRGEGADRV